MTLMQIISTGLAAIATLYYSQTFFKKEFALKSTNAIIWAALAMWAAISWVGVR